MIPQYPWQRVHVDHDHFGGRLLLVAVDAYSKWPEVHIVSSTSAQQTIDKLHQIFACHGLPATLVSNNGSPFQSTEFQQFVAANGILHRKVPPYHPSSNGLAENMVKTVKHALSKAKVTKDATLDTLIACYWLHTITLDTPQHPEHRQSCSSTVYHGLAFLWYTLVLHSDWNKLLRCKWATSNLKVLLSTIMSWYVIFAPMRLTGGEKAL